MSITKKGRDGNRRPAPIGSASRIYFLSFFAKPQFQPMMSITFRILAIRESSLGEGVIAAIAAAADMVVVNTSQIATLLAIILASRSSNNSVLLDTMVPYLRGNSISTTRSHEVDDILAQAKTKGIVYCCGYANYDGYEDLIVLEFLKHFILLPMV